jgi:transposase
VVKQVARAKWQLTQRGFGPWARIYRKAQGRERQCVQLAILSWDALDERSWPGVTEMEPADIARVLGIYAQRVITSLGIDVEVVNRNPGVRGFHVVKRRWVVERSIGWIMLHRRLARDYETLPASSEAMIHVASIDNLTKRTTDETTPTWRGTY